MANGSFVPSGDNLKKKNPANTSVRSRSLPGFLTSFSFVTHTRCKTAYFATATAPKICSRSYFVKEPLSVNIENSARDQKIRSFFLISPQKTLLVLKLFSSLDRPKPGRRLKGNYFQNARTTKKTANL